MLGLRGWVLTDPWHIGWGAVKQAVTDVSAWITALEITVVQNSRRGPFAGSASIGQIREASEHHFQHIDISP